MSIQSRHIVIEVKMDDDGGLSWNKIVTLIFVIASIIVLLMLVFLMFVMPSLRQ